MIGSLFSGVGGLELGLEAAGFGPVAWQVEMDPFCREVLAKHWPNADQGTFDVRDAGAATLAPVDLICGGFPCQDVSAAGKRAGLEGARSGLWYEFARVVAELRPAFVVVENVASGAKRWLPTVRSRLCELGYDTAALAVSAADVGAPHRRARIFVVGVADADRQGQRQQGRPIPDERRRTRDSREVADAESERRTQGRAKSARQQGRLGVASGRAAVGDPDGASRLEGRRLCAGERVTEPGLGRVPDGLPARLDEHRWPASRGAPQHAHEAPRTQPRGAVANRPARLKALGNAVVPQCAQVVGRYLRALIDARDAA